MGGFCGERMKAGATLEGSTVTGNGTACEVGDDACADIVTCRKRPRVKPGSTCETSLDANAAGTDWDVCTLD